MIRFLQTPGPIKKIILGGLLVFISAMMAISLIPGIGSSGFLAGTPAHGVVATVDGVDVSAQDVQHQAKVALQRQFPRGGAQMSMYLPFFASQAAQQLINEQVILVEARRMGMKATDEDLRDFTASSWRLAERRLAKTEHV